MSNLGGIVTFGAAVLRALLATTLLASSADAQTSDVPADLKRSAECMLKALKTVPGVTEPKLGYVTNEGWTHPFLEYSAAEVNSWVQPTRFEAQKSDTGKYWFLGSLPGVISPEIGDADIHVTEAVMKKWKAQCNVEVNAMLN